MKKLLLLCSILLTAITASAGNNDNGTKNDIAPFAQTRIGVPATVHFLTGEEFAYLATSEEDCDLDRLQVDVKDGVLCFTLADELAYGETLSYDITIIAPATPELRLATSYEVASITLAEDSSLAMAE